MGVRKLSRANGGDAKIHIIFVNAAGYGLSSSYGSL